LCCKGIPVPAAEAARTVQGTTVQGEIIVLCVRWNLRSPLSLRQLEEIVAERNPSVDHVTI
jgi:transposase-like protein